MDQNPTMPQPLAKGLDPQKCRSALEASRRMEARNRIRHIAVELYKHTKCTDVWREKYCIDGKNNLMHWIMRFDSAGTWNDLESLYYMSCYIVLGLNQDLQDRMAAGLLTWDSVMHNFGDRMVDSSKVTVARMNQNLHNAWEALQDPSLVARLDYEIEKEEDAVQKLGRKKWLAVFQPEHPNSTGLLNIHQIPHHAIAEAVLHRHEGQMATDRTEKENDRIAKNRAEAEAMPHKATVKNLLENLKEDLKEKLVGNGHGLQLDAAQKVAVRTVAIQQAHADRTNYPFYAPSNDIASLEVTRVALCSPPTIESGLNNIQKEIEKRQVRFIEEATYIHPPKVAKKPKAAPVPQRSTPTLRQLKERAGLTVAKKVPELLTPPQSSKKSTFPPETVSQSSTRFPLIVPQPRTPATGALDLPTPPTSSRKVQSLDSSAPTVSPGSPTEHHSTEVDRFNAIQPPDREKAYEEIRAMRAADRKWLQDQQKRFQGFFDDLQHLSERRDAREELEKRMTSRPTFNEPNTPGAKPLLSPALSSFMDQAKVFELYQRSDQSLPWPQFFHFWTQDGISDNEITLSEQAVSRSPSATDEEHLTFAEKMKMMQDHQDHLDMRTGWTNFWLTKQVYYFPEELILTNMLQSAMRQAKVLQESVKNFPLRPLQPAINPEEYGQMKMGKKMSQQEFNSTHSALYKLGSGHN